MNKVRDLYRPKSSGIYMSDSSKQLHQQVSSIRVKMLLTKIDGVSIHSACGGPVVPRALRGEVRPPPPLGETLVDTFGQGEPAPLQVLPTPRHQTRQPLYRAAQLRVRLTAAVRHTQSESDKYFLLWEMNACKQRYVIQIPS